jgi:hypothetical protein
MRSRGAVRMDLLLASTTLVLGLVLWTMPAEGC